MIIIFITDPIMVNRRRFCLGFRIRSLKVCWLLERAFDYLDREKRYVVLDLSFLFQYYKE